MRSTAGWALVLSITCAGVVGAHDVWESGTIVECIDDATTTCNQLMPGVSQVHDLQGGPPTPDVDFMLVETKARHSYEVDVRGGTFPFEGSSCTGCPEIDRVNAAGAILTAGSAPEPNHPLTFSSVRQVVRWTGGPTDQRDFIRVKGPVALTFTAADRYELVLRDTSLAVPRWNNNGTQLTVLLLSNQAPHDVQGHMHFYDIPGQLVESVPFVIPRSGMLVFQSYLRQSLMGGNGSATITHNAGYGELVGKAISVEPATGFTFDTAITPVPY